MSHPPRSKQSTLLPFSKINPNRYLGAWDGLLWEFSKLHRHDDGTVGHDLYGRDPITGKRKARFDKIISVDP